MNSTSVGWEICSEHRAHGLCFVNIGQGKGRFKYLHLPDMEPLIQRKVDGMKSFHVVLCLDRPFSNGNEGAVV